ncbi:cytochrome C oxidase subunit IV family protein [Aquimarina sp. MAR_2010_214]|uniref:cytochrome C oxidase subunit IV family protein n=1 Tax=Aquimarina sp. MAR_2010_214 TaxID=1250026 RepID=UPI000C6FCC66|nr:cytochrome C oxidase subunit IV family protein [Aquimarina sp. MAR_2010_214]
MNKTAIYTWILLLILTVVSALFSQVEGKYIVLVILILSVLKFIGVAFQFMELKNAHSFWKYAIIFFVLLFMVIVMII